MSPKHPIRATRFRPGTLAVACHLTLASMFGLGATGSAHAQTASARTQVSVSAGSLADALARFAQQSGVSLSIDAERLRGLQSPGLNGSYTVDEGFGALLQGSGFAITRTSAGYVLAQSAPSPALAQQGVPTTAQPGATDNVTALPSVKVTATAESAATTEGTGSYTSREVGTATRLELSLRETPQSISVITRQRMDDQGLVQLADVIAQTPGLVVSQSGNQGSDSSPIYARGFGVQNYMVDGVGMAFSGYTDLFQSNDMALYDRVEIVRGANGLMSGVGAAGATINMIRKRPTPFFQASARAEAGSWNFYRGQADISAPLNQAGSIRGRVVAALQDNDSYIDRLHERTKVLYGIVEADITPRTLATAGVSIQHHDATGHSRGGLPAYYTDGTRTHWARSDSAAAEWAYSKRANESVFGSLEHKFDNEWRVKGSFTHGTADYDELLGYATGGNPNPLTGAGVILYASRWVGNPKIDNFDLYTTGPFTLFGRKHEAVFGATVSTSTVDSPTFGGWRLLPVADINTWDGVTPVNPNAPVAGNYKDDERGRSAYATVRLRPTDAVSVILGARTTDWKRDQATLTDSTGVLALTNRKDSQLTPYAGVTWDVSKHWSVYASYTDIFRPQNQKTVTGAYIDPLIGNSYEAGAKAEFFDKRLNVAAAVYQVEQGNLAVAIPNTFAPDGSAAYESVSGTKTRGFEMEASGEMARNLQGSISFARNIVQDRNGAPLQTGVPQNTFKVFSTYRFNNIGNGLTVGGGVRWQNQIYAVNQGPLRVRFTQPAYALVDLMARYQVTSKVAASINLNNVTDKVYFAATGNSYYGPPRNVRVALDVQF